ncbi:T9SS type A sorting domain-containing protein, partial [bacterium]|nr:T9SS type A sorting domain-containing protein [bacterium]
SQNLSMSKQGSLFFGDYLIQGTGLLTVAANGMDSSLNPGMTINRTYTVSPLAKPLTLSSYRIESAGNGYLITGLSDAGHTPTGWTRIGSAIDIAAAGAASAEIRVTLMSNPASDQSKIGLYLWSNEQWTPLSMERKNGQWSATVSGGTVGAFYNSDVSAIPSEFKLHGNYPNPFNPSTTISYEIPIQGKVVIKIYNTLGQEIRTLVNEVKPAGFHKLVWDGRNNNGQSISSGLYIYRLQTDRFVKSHKMILLK